VCGSSPPCCPAAAAATLPLKLRAKSLEGLKRAYELARYRAPRPRAHRRHRQADTGKEHTNTVARAGGEGGARGPRALYRLSQTNSIRVRDWRGARWGGAEGVGRGEERRGEVDKSFSFPCASEILRDRPANENRAPRRPAIPAVSLAFEITRATPAIDNTHVYCPCNEHIRKAQLTINYMYEL
jgi:hypothetical protein